MINSHTNNDVFSYYSAFQTFRQSTFPYRNQITEGYEWDGQDFV